MDQLKKIFNDIEHYGFMEHLFLKQRVTALKCADLITEEEEIGLMELVNAKNKEDRVVLRSILEAKEINTGNPFVWDVRGK